MLLVFYRPINPFALTILIFDPAQVEVDEDPAEVKKDEQDANADEVIH